MRHVLITALLVTSFGCGWEDPVESESPQASALRDQAIAQLQADYVQMDPEQKSVLLYRLADLYHEKSLVLMGTGDPEWEIYRKKAVDIWSYSYAQYPEHPRRAEMQKYLLMYGR